MGEDLLKEAIREAVQTTKDIALLDLIYRLLILENKKGG